MTRLIAELQQTHADLGELAEAETRLTAVADRLAASVVRLQRIAAQHQQITQRSDLAGPVVAGSYGD